MKKPAIIVIVLLVVSLGTGLIVKNLKKPTPPPAATTEAKPKKRITEPVNVIPEKDRPYLQIVPLADGRNLNLVVKEVKKTTTDMDYELEYQAGTLLQVAMGNLVTNKLPIEKKILMGSCSAGGACSYHTDIQGMTLLARFQGQEVYAVKSEWKYFDNKDKQVDFSSKDGKFQLSSNDLSNSRYLIIFNSPGYPKEPKGQIVSEHYSLTTSDANLKGKAQISIRAKEEGKLVIVGWNGTKWVEFETTVDNEDKKQAKTTVDLMELFLVVKK